MLSSSVSQTRRFGSACQPDERSFRPGRSGSLPRRSCQVGGKGRRFMHARGQRLAGRYADGRAAHPRSSRGVSGGPAAVTRRPKTARRAGHASARPWSCHPLRPPRRRALAESAAAWGGKDPSVVYVPLARAPEPRRNVACSRGWLRARTQARMAGRNSVRSPHRAGAGRLRARQCCRGRGELS
jgi:hypothetical protein